MRTPIKLEGLNYLELDEEPMIAVLPPEIRKMRTKKEGISLKELTDALSLFTGGTKNF